MLSRWINKILFLDYRILHPKGFHISNCPGCGDFATLERMSHEKRWEKFIKALGFRKYHCMKCKWEGYLHSVSITDQPKNVTRNYLIALFWFIIFAFILYYFLSDYYDTLVQ
ncbi:MAG: hypothetical protein LWX07_11710 [Bacteroidetes bacterium]|nr:hypothetical protein [Bacteroidota bacterium]